MKMTKTYYTLLIKQGGRDGRAFDWSPEFGDYDHETVEGEIDSLIDSYCMDFDRMYKKSDFKIISTNGTQEAINARIAQLNAKNDEPKLVSEITGETLSEGDIVQFEGKPVVLVTITKPHKPSSTGRVYVRFENGTHREFFPSVVGGVWINRTDRGV